MAADDEDFTAADERMRFVDLVNDELRGKASPAAVAELEADPERWKAALATIVEDIDAQLARRSHDREWAKRARLAKRNALARLVDVRRQVKAGRRVTELRNLQARYDELCGVLRSIEAVVDDEQLSDRHVVDRVAAILDELHEPARRAS